MTPELIRARILKVSQDELRRIVDELKAYPPNDAEFLLAVCREAQDDLAAQARRLRDDRGAVSRR